MGCASVTGDAPYNQHGLLKPQQPVVATCMCPQTWCRACCGHPETGVGASLHPAVLPMPLLYRCSCCAAPGWCSAFPALSEFSCLFGLHGAHVRCLFRVSVTSSSSSPQHPLLPQQQPGAGCVLSGCCCCRRHIPAAMVSSVAAGGPCMVSSVAGAGCMPQNAVSAAAGRVFPSQHSIKAPEGAQRARRHPVVAELKVTGCGLAPRRWLG